MKYYVIADLHGRYDLLSEAVNAIEKHSANEDDTRVITLGDYIDRGPDSNKVIEFLMNRGKNWTSLMGNHEDMAVKVCSDPHYDHKMWWIGNGGGNTLQSYGHDSVHFVDQYSMSVMNEDHLKWMASLPLYFETEKQVFVHAGIPTKDAPLDKQDKEKLIWMLYDKNDHGGWQGKHVVHGHHQFADGPHTWSGRTDLDTFAWNTGRLVIGVFDDTQGPALEFIEVSV